MRYELAGELAVALPPAEAWVLFTPRGEEAWVDGWRPRFPSPAEDDTAPGTVFLTDSHGARTTWVVVDSEPGRRVRYSRHAHDTSAGTVTVELAADAAGTGSTVAVTYTLTALTAEAGPDLARFAAHYPEFLRGWQDAIAGSLTG
ncbi:MAG: hypothetical protein ACJ73S_22760 [Mycobacteriales bacterium]|jgi:hypothetical protein